MQYNSLFLTLICFCFSLGIAKAQTPIEDQILIWNGIAPGSETVTVTEEIEDRDPDGGPCHLNRTVRKVTEPTIKHFAPEHPNGTAVLICPGGGYALLAYDKEGYDIAQWYNERDITAFVLKYRLPIDGHANRQFVPLQDAQRALRYIRANAADFNINPDSIGVMGGSAGGHLAASLSVFYDWEVYAPQDAIDSNSARPNFSVLMYPVISFQDTLTHSGSRSNLLGAPITELAKDSFSTELHIDSATPPAFLFHSKLDGSVKYQNSVVYANALEDAGVDYSLNLYNTGGHGIGKCEAGLTAFSQWPIDLDAWLVAQGWTTPCVGESPEITVELGATTQLIASPAPGYQWYRNGIPVNGATDSVYVPVIIGDYKVAVPGQRVGSGSDCMIFSEEVFVDQLSDIEELTTNTLHIYPNPASTEIYVDLADAKSYPVNYYLYNHLGACVAKGTANPGNGSITIDVNTLNSGFYYLNLQLDGQQVKGRFIKH